VTTVSVLDRELYSIADAARLLRIPASTLAWWLDGGERQGRRYPPVLREELQPGSLVTWAEFVEARLLRGYRNAGVPLQNIRPFIDSVRERLRTPYPLVHYKPYVDQKQLVYDLQRDTRLDPRLYLVRPGEGDQLQFAPPVLDFLRVVDFDETHDVASRIRPLGKDSRLAIDPDLRFGQPQIDGVRADAIAELAEAESVTAAAAEWGISEQDVWDALRWQERSAA
jgi:uncharacterized protein (DUF433 family)